MRLSSLNLQNNLSAALSKAEADFAQNWISRRERRSHLLALVFNLYANIFLAYWFASSPPSNPPVRNLQFLAPSTHFSLSQDRNLTSFACSLATLDVSLVASVSSGVVMFHLVARGVRLHRDGVAAFAVVWT